MSARPTRTQTILSHVHDALRNTRLTERAFADAVVDVYHERTALHDRTVEFHAGATVDAVEAAQRANAQIFKRMVEGHVRLPADIEEAVVLALPEPYRRSCIAALADRMELLPIPKPSPQSRAQLATAADLLTECGDTLQRLAPMFDDGVIDFRDRPHAPAALRELDQLIAAAVCLRTQISAGTAGDSVVTSLRSVPNVNV